MTTEIDLQHGECRFTPSFMYRKWKKGSWKAKRHGEFRARLCSLDATSENVWPFNCQYYDSSTMDPIQSRDLNTRDTKYASSNEPIRLIEFESTSPAEYVLSLGPEEMANFRNVFSTPNSTTKVIFISQWRRYSTAGSTVELGVDAKTWQSLLEVLELPPNVVELLHENNGGVWQHISHSEVSDVSGPVPNAFHICFKSSQFEMMYGRYDCLTRSSLVLVMGGDLEWERHRLLSQFRNQHRIGLLQILLAVLGTWLQKLEQSRWSLDLAVLQLEQNTESSQLTGQAEPLPPHQLHVLRDDIAGAQGYIRSIARHSACMGMLFEAFNDAVTRFRRLEHIPGDKLEEQILDAIGQYRSQQRSQATQANDLSWRIDTQWSALVALKSKHDSEVIIAMAQDTRSDNVLMRQTAAVSVVFLPATFLATFFSMMFFQVDNSGDLSISGYIWVYFVLTTGLSPSIWLYFRFLKRWKKLTQNLVQKVMQRKDLPISALEKSV